MKVITFTTDFGWSDSYVSAMKGVILSSFRDVHLIDITHSIPPQDIVAAHFILADVWKKFPNGTVHLGVVDPNVGTARRRIIVLADGHYFVGPDNGLFGFTLDSRERKFWKIRGTFEKDVSATFEGRDIFAPVAAELAKGTSPGKLGEPAETIRNITLPTTTVGPKGITGEVVAIDRFGNLIANITKRGLKKSPDVIVGRRSVGPLRRTYADVGPGQLLALWNSAGRLEIAVRNGSAQDVLKAKKGIKVTAKT